MRDLLRTNSIDEVVTNVEESSFSEVVFAVSRLVSIKQIISGKMISNAVVTSKIKLK